MVEVVADQQQWSFYARRAKFRSSKGGSKSDQGVDPDLVNGFNTQGLFRFCRHPNFFAEQGLWVCVWVFSLATQHSSLSALTGSLQTWAEQVWETRDFALALETLFSKEILNER